MSPLTSWLTSVRCLANHLLFLLSKNKKVPQGQIEHRHRTALSLNSTSFKFKSLQIILAQTSTKRLHQRSVQTHTDRTIWEGNLLTLKIDRRAPNRNLSLCAKTDRRLRNPCNSNSHSIMREVRQLQMMRIQILWMYNRSVALHNRQQWRSLISSLFLRIYHLVFPFADPKRRPWNPWRPT